MRGSTKNTITGEELKVICDTTVRLTELRQRLLGFFSAYVFLLDIYAIGVYDLTIKITEYITLTKEISYDNESYKAHSP